MAHLRPFPALRPRPDLAARLCELPYDVMSSDEARAQAVGNPLSFLHVSKPEIDLPPGTDPYAPEVYAKGRANFHHLITTGALWQDATAHYYLYRQVMGRHSQTGLVAAASCADYLSGVIKRHELTRVDKEDDRVRHLEALDAQTGPAFLTYRAVPALDALAARVTAGLPDVDFTAPDGVRHTAWTVLEPADTAQITAEFARLPCLYIADGHHRSAAAARVCATRQGAGGSDAFLAVIFPHDQMQILPYHRVLKDLNGLTPAGLRARLLEVFEPLPDGPAQPAQPHHVSLFLEDRWQALAFRLGLTCAPSPLERLDVTLLQTHVLAPVCGIADPRTSQRLGFVGGIRGTAELERLVRGGEYACAFALPPTGIEELMTIADAGGIMPPKSTWFEPKLRDGMFSQRL
jgi:uncharacterized protein (DUF1015 family)